ENLLFDQSQPDLVSQLQRRAEQIVQVISIPPTPSPLITDMGTDTEDEEEEDQRQTQHQDQENDVQIQPYTATGLLTPSTEVSFSRYVTPETGLPEVNPSPQPASDTGGQFESDNIHNRQQNTAPRAEEISGNISEENIIASRTRRRRQVYLAALGKPEE